MPWKTLSSRVAYENPWLWVREDEVRRPDGSEGLYGVVETRSPPVFVVALTEADEVVLVEIERYTTGETSLEVPAGATDGEDPLAAARRELQEESGLAATTWRELGHLDSVNGFSTERGTVFLATGLSGGLPDNAAAEGIVAVRRVPFADLVRMVGQGAITDGQTVSALTLAGIALGRFA